MFVFRCVCFSICHKNPSNSDLFGALWRYRWQLFVCLDRCSHFTGWDTQQDSCVQACMFVCCNDLRRADCAGDVSGSRFTARSTLESNGQQVPCARAQVQRAHPYSILSPSIFLPLRRWASYQHLLTGLVPGLARAAALVDCLAEHSSSKPR